MPLFILPSKNHLGKGSAPYCIHSKRSGSIDQATIVDLIAQCFPTLAKSLVDACFAKFFELVGTHISAGETVKTSIGSFYLCASGQLEYSEQVFDPRAEGSKHKLRIHYRPARSFERSVTAHACVERLSQAPLLIPTLLSACASQNYRRKTAKAGEFIRVSGRQLEFDKSDSLVGLFFLNGSEKRSETYSQIHPSSFTAQLPFDLAPGSYTLAFRTKIPSGELFECRLEKPFLVEK